MLLGVRNAEVLDGRQTLPHENTTTRADGNKLACAGVQPAPDHQLVRHQRSNERAAVGRSLMQHGPIHRSLYLL